MLASCASCLATELACCFGKTACKCFGLACGSSITTRIGYSMMLMSTAILSWVMLTDWATRKIESWTWGYFQIKCQEGPCYGTFAVFRICFATTLFHLAMSLLTYGVRSSREFRSHIHNGFWAFKLLTWIGLIVMAFFIPNGFFIGFSAYVDMPGAMLFVLIQIVLLIDFAYGVSEALLARWEDTGDQKAIAALLFITFGAYVSAVVMTGFLYAWFGKSDCQLNQFYISFNLVLCLILSVISILPRVQEGNPKSGLGQSAMVTLYTTYLIASAMSNEPLPAGQTENHCNPLDQSSSSQTTSIVVGAIFTFIAIAYSTSSAASKGIHFVSDESSIPLISDQPSSHLMDAVESGAIPSSSLGEDQDNDDERDGVNYNYSFFHFVFSIAAMYLAMLLTNWNSVTVTESDKVAHVGKSMAAVWVKVVSSWLVILLYTWTLLAPVLLPDREFF